MSEKMILGAQLYTVRDYMKNEEDFARTMERIAKIGYKYVQVSGIGDVSAQAIAKAVKDTGLKVILTSTTDRGDRRASSASRTISPRLSRRSRRRERSSCTITISSSSSAARIRGCSLITS